MNAVSESSYLSITKWNCYHNQLLTKMNALPIWFFDPKFLMITLGPVLENAAIMQIVMESLINEIFH
jgi:hypothetical protein